MVDYFEFIIKDVEYYFDNFISLLGVEKDNTSGNKKLLSAYDNGKNNRVITPSGIDLQKEINAALTQELYTELTQHIFAELIKNSPIYNLSYHYALSTGVNIFNLENMDATFAVIKLQVEYAKSNINAKWAIVSPVIFTIMKVVFNEFIEKTDKRVFPYGKRYVCENLDIFVDQYAADKLFVIGNENSFKLLGFGLSFENDRYYSDYEIIINESNILQVYE